MKRIFIFLLLFVVSAVNVHLRANNYPQVSEHQLSNGMTVWLYEDRSIPKVMGAVVVKVGAKDSPNTGIAHYLEHMLFKGTQKIGTTNYEVEKSYMDQLVVLYDALQKCNEPLQIDSIQRLINKVNIEQSKYVLNNEFDHIISQYGGSGLNAYTGYDQTVYYNSFMPEYMQKWAEVSSERFLDPVFRMFQSELETVYEEKNMYSDNMYSRAMQQILKLYYIGTPYEYDIIGGTDALKKPDFNGMIDFYNSYYVGNNMALVLSGDFNSNEILPILEKSFGRIPSGKKKIEELVVLQSISGRQEETVNIPIPVVKAMAHLYRGASVNSEDKVSLELACLLLNNSSGTGYLDQLTTDGKLLMAMAMNIDVANAGSILGVGAIPKLVVQSEKAAEKLVMEQVERIKKGDFTDALFLSLKNEKLREILQYIETPSGVFDKMLELYPKGLNWQNYLEELSYINEITREDVVAAANKYFTNNYIYVSKKNGSYEQDKINKPNIEPIPMNVSQESQYSVYFDSLKKADEIVPQVRYLDFNRFTPYEFLSDSCSLYYNQIKANGIFELAWYFEVGERNDPKIGMLSSYLSLLGTDSLSFQELKTALQMLGSDISFGSSNNYFDITVTGFDANFEPTIKLLNHFMNRVKGDKKMMKQLVSALKMEEVSFTKDGDNIAAAIVEKVKLGDASPYLNRISSKDMKKMNSEALLSLFDNVKQYKSSLHYTGSLTSDEIMRALSRQLSRENSTKGAVNYELIDYKPVEKPVVYFYDIPKSRQTIIYAYQTSKNPIKEGKRSDWRLLNYYWGGDMKSVMFHEVREARSMAYGAYSRLFMNIPKYDDKKIAMVSYMSTQNDKALEAVALLDSLIKNMPMDEQRFESMKRSMANNANNLYPSEREATFEIMDDLNAGYKSSSLKEVGDAVNLNMNSIEEVYNRQIKDAPIVYVVVGNKKDIDFDMLKQYGEVIVVKEKDIYKK